ncbi:TonB-dependent receptor [Metallibacterium scheffleri]|uniref:TonB-dependent receptor n=1 Tax=Metallibacterium scheffleri TaxID=993689 RepID=UPI001F5B03B8|nr:TonB-dependent receptor [Metallibacterium scheffleri]
MIQLKRNVLAMALASSLGVVAFGTVHAAPASSAQAGNVQGGSAAQATTVPAQTATNADTGTTSKAAARKRIQEEAKKAKVMGAVVVSGYASSLQNSIMLQRYSNNIVEAVSAEQIGKLPGISIADTLGRLPGLAVQTLNGRPQVLTIHGFGPDFSTALVDGQEQVSTGNNRGVQFDQYPSSWFGNVIVHITPNADLVGQGLAGTVNMRTIRPLEHDHSFGAVNVAYNWDQLAELSPGGSNSGQDINGIFVDQFAHHTFGVTLGVDLQSVPTQIQHQAPWGYPTDSAGDLYIGGSKNYGISDNLNRTALLTTFQWRPSKDFDSTLILTYDNFRESQQNKGMEFPLGYGAQASGAPLPFTPGSVSNGFVNTGTFGDVYPVIRNDFNWFHSKVYNINWRNKLRFNEDWSAEINVGYSRANRQSVQLETYSEYGYNRTGPTSTVGFSELGDGMLMLNPSLNYASNQIVLTDPQGWGAGSNIVQAGYANLPNTEDYIGNINLSLKRDFEDGPFSSAVLGFNRATRNKTYTNNGDYLTLPNGTETLATNPIGAQTAPIPGGALYGNGSCDPLAWMGIGPEVCYDPLYLLNNNDYYIYPWSASPSAQPPNWSVRQNTYVPYFQLNIQSRVGAVPVRGNIGIQISATDQMSTGGHSVAGLNGASRLQEVPVSGSTKYTRYLPSLNLIFGIARNTDLRFSAARVMARPRMDEMNAGLGVSGNITLLPSTNPNQAYFSASGGNPQLLPTMADNYNLSLEHYFDQNKGYLQFEGYFFQLHDYINPSAAILYNFSAFEPYYLDASQQAQLGTPYGIMSGPVNNGHGYVRGLQAVASLPLDLILRPLEGFGINTSANYTKSSIVYGENPTPVTVPGLSKWVLSSTVYYQHDGFQARVSDTYRSSFLGEISGLGATRVLQTIQGEHTIDAQVSYAFSSGRFKNLTLILQGSNLNDALFKTFQNNDPRQVIFWERYGRYYSLQASYRF